MHTGLAFTVAFCLFLSTVQAHAQLNCLQGHESQRATTMKSKPCPNDGQSYSCKRYDLTATVLGRSGEPFIFYLQQLIDYYYFYFVLR